MSALKLVLSILFIADRTKSYQRNCNFRFIFSKRTIIFACTALTRYSHCIVIFAYIGITQGYWRAAKAHKELGQVDFALDAAIGGYNVSVNQNQEEEIISFLVEIVSIIITLRR